MRNAIVRLAFAAAALGLSAGDVNAVCSTDVPIWVNTAIAARNHRCSSGGPEWSIDVNAHADFCLRATQEERENRTETMQRYLRTCALCAAVVDQTMSAIYHNDLYGCGLSYPDGRLTPNREYQIDQCTTAYTLLKEPERNVWLLARDEVLKQVNICRLHKSPTPPAVTLPKTIPPVQDKIDRPKHASKPAKKCRSPTATKGCNTGGLATVKPAPKGSATSPKPSGGSNTSAMDRLSGDSQLPSSSNPSSKIRDGGSGRLPARGGGASAVAKPVTAPAPLPKADPTTDFGKCASCGKPPAAPR